MTRIAVITALSITACPAESDEQGSLSDFEFSIWKTHVVTLLNAAADASPEQLSESGRQYRSAAAISRTSLLDYGMALVMYQHGQYPRAQQHADAAWKTPSRWSVEAMELKAAVILSKDRDQADELRALVEQLLDRTEDASVSEEVRYDTARFAGRVLSLSQALHTSVQEAQQWRLLDDRARGNRSSRIIEAYDDGCRTAEELLKGATATQTEKSRQVKTDLSRRLQKVADQGKTARKMSEDLTEVSRLTRRDLEQQLNQIDTALATCDRRFREIYPQWQNLSVAAPALEHGLKNSGVIDVVVLGRKYTRSQITIAATQSRLQLSQTAAELQGIMTTVNDLLAARVTLGRQYAAVAGQQLAAKESIDLWNKRLRSQKGALNERLTEVTSKKTASHLKADLVLPFDAAEGIKEIRSLMAVM
ncbi:MAG: hypothetical protein KDA89_10935 [Planctomycetaceae bacterium]|nr:hypothetical protein [Planctomycetaceae bacterium]